MLSPDITLIYSWHHNRIFWFDYHPAVFQNFLKISWLCRNHLKLLDAPRASPRRWGAPVAIVLYYLFKKMREVSGQVISRHRMRPRPQRGQAGLAQGGQPNLMKQVFYRADFLYYFPVCSISLDILREESPSRKPVRNTHGFW